MCILRWYHAIINYVLEFKINATPVQKILKHYSSFFLSIQNLIFNFQTPKNFVSQKSQTQPHF